MSEENKALARRFYEEVVNASRLELIDELLSPAFIEHEEFAGLSPDREGVKQFFAMFQQAFPDLIFTVNHLVAEGNLVAAHITMRGTHEDEFLGAAPTGRQIVVQTFDLLRFSNGKCVEHWGITDTLALMQQLGVMSAP